MHCFCYLNLMMSQGLHQFWTQLHTIAIPSVGNCRRRHHLYCCMQLLYSCWKFVPMLCLNNSEDNNNNNKIRVQWFNKNVTKINYLHCFILQSKSNRNFQDQLLNKGQSFCTVICNITHFNSRKSV